MPFPAGPFTLGPASIVTGDGSSTFGRLRIEDGRIIDLLGADGPSDLSIPAKATIAPGLIDVHTNGAANMLFNRDHGNAVPVASHEYAKMGATAFVASVMTAPWESMLHAAEAIVDAAHDLQDHGAQGARCLGVHFEGPFLNPKFRRVHRAEWLLEASPQRVSEMFDACRGGLLMVTLAPEVLGAADAARFLSERGVVCSAGHTAARYRDGMLAIGVGFRSLTHAFNGMPQLDHRDPSILAAFVQDRRTHVQLICDGEHVAPVMVDILYRTLGDRVVIATDHMPPAGPGYHVMNGTMRAEDGTIAGSALHIDQGVRNYMSFADLSFAQAIIAATHAPAAMLGLHRELGRIAKGLRADLSFWDADYNVVGTMLAGKPIYGDIFSTDASASAIS